MDTLHPSAGISHGRANTPHYIIDGHCEPFVHLGHVILSIQCLSNYLWDKHEIKMFAYLLFKMIYCGVDESNNVLLFVKFANLHFNAWTQIKSDPVPEETSFLDAYQPGTVAV
jgi:hypothetical protein